MSQYSRLQACTAVTVFCLLALGALFLQAPSILWNQETHKVVSSATDLPHSPPIGIGFDLTAFYGTAVISFPNGSSVNVARVEAKPEYRKTLRKLSLDSSTHPVPPYNNQGEYVADRPRQIRRQARKALGLPASDEVGAISVLLKEIRSAVEAHLGHSIDTAVAATPHLVALYEEDLADASEHIGLQLQYLPYWHNHMKETGAAYVGYGLGLCGNYTDQPACDDEMQAMPSENIMALLYTKQALTVTLSKMQSALYMWEPRYRYREHFALGHDALGENPGEEYYWECVRQALMEIMVANPYYPRPDKVLLMGECINDTQFRVVLEDALGSLMDDMPDILAENAVYVAAKGAAELAKRGPYYPWLQNQERKKGPDFRWENAEVEEKDAMADNISNEPLWAFPQKYINPDM